MKYLSSIAIVICLVFLIPSTSQAASECFAAGNYWVGFRDYWFSYFRQQSAMVLMVLGVGAFSIFIITRGKWKK